MKKILTLLILLQAFLLASEFEAKAKIYGEFIELQYSGGSYTPIVTEYIPIGNITSFSKYKERNSNNSNISEEKYQILAYGFMSSEYQQRYIISKEAFEELMYKARITQNKNSENEKSNHNILKSTNP